MALAFASSIARDATMVTQMSALADRAMMKARNVDSQQQTTRKLVRQDLLLKGEANAKAKVPLTNFQFGEISPSLYQEQIQGYIITLLKRLKTSF